MKKLIKQSNLGINEDNVSEILSQTCLLTNLVIRGKKGSLSLEKYLEINKVPDCVKNGKPYNQMSKEEKMEVEAYKVGKKIRTSMSYIPKDVLKKLDTKQSNLRHKYYDVCVAPNYMTTKSYEDFKDQEIEKISSEIDEILDDVVSHWDTYINTFKNDLLAKYPYLDETKVDKLISTLGDGEGFKNSYSIQLEYTPIPSNFSVQGMSQAYQKDAYKKVNEDAANEIADIIGNALNNTFQGLNRVLISNNSLRNVNSKVAVGAKTKASMINSGIELDAKVGFLKIDELDELVEKVNETVKIKDDQTLIEEVEVCLSLIYNFMKDNDFIEYLDLEDSVLSEDLLEVYA